MSLPSYTETLGSPLGPDITIIEGDLFSDDENGAELDINTMNKEMNELSSGKDGIVFMESEAQKDDVPFLRFLESKQKTRVGSE